MVGGWKNVLCKNHFRCYFARLKFISSMNCKNIISIFTFVYFCPFRGHFEGSFTKMKSLGDRKAGERGE